MPKVGNEEFAYTPQGIQAAKQKSAATGIPVSNAAERSVVNHAGTGQANFNSIGQQPMNPMQQPMYKDGGKVKDQRVKDYEDRFKNKEQKATKELAPAATKKRKRVLPKAGKKPRANTNFQKMLDKEIMELMESQHKYEEGGKVKYEEGGYTNVKHPGKTWKSEDHFYEDVVEPEIAAKEKAKADAKAKKDKQASDKKIKDRDKKDKEKGAKKYGPSWGASDDMPGGSGRE